MTYMLSLFVASTVVVISVYGRQPVHHVRFTSDSSPTQVIDLIVACATGVARRLIQIVSVELGHDRGTTLHASTVESVRDLLVVHLYVLLMIMTLATDDSCVGYHDTGTAH